MRCQQSKRVWSGSRMFRGVTWLIKSMWILVLHVCNMTRGFLHIWMVHALTCGGILPTQYINLCNFVGIGGRRDLLWCVRCECSSLLCSYSKYVGCFHTSKCCSNAQNFLYRLYRLDTLVILAAELSTRRSRGCATTHIVHRQWGWCALSVGWPSPGWSLLCVCLHM